MAKKPAFFTYHEHGDIILGLSDEDAGKLWKSLLLYSRDGATPELPQHLSIAFGFLKVSIDAGAKAYQARCEKNRENANIRWKPNDASSPVLCDGIRSHAMASDLCDRMQMMPKEKEKENKENTPHIPPEGEAGTSKKKRSKKANDPNPDFDRFWSLYPKKDGKQDALRAWKKLSPDEELQEKICSAVQRSCASPQWQKDGGQYIMQASKYLNGRRWEDEPTVLPSQPIPKRENLKCINSIRRLKDD